MKLYLYHILLTIKKTVKKKREKVEKALTITEKNMDTSVFGLILRIRVQ